MAKEPRVFRSNRDKRAPTPFRLVFEVPEMEKVPIYAEGVDPSESEPLSYEEQETGNWVEEERLFHFTHQVPGGLVLDIQGASSENQASSARQANAVRRLFEKVIVERDEFLTLFYDDRYIINAEMANDLINAIIEESGDRPT